MSNMSICEKLSFTNKIYKDIKDLLADVTVSFRGYRNGTLVENGLRKHFSVNNHVDLFLAFFEVMFTCFIPNGSFPSRNTAVSG